MRQRRSNPEWVGLWVLLLITAARPGALEAQSLRGSPASLDRQNRIARQEDYTFIRTGDRVRYFAQQGWLVRVRPNSDFTLHGVSFPYARPEVELFIRRLGAEYRGACGEQLVVTSLTRPLNHQPTNASDRSVHPTGMAVDLRYSRDRRCRAWLEDVLVELEHAGIVEATRELHPLHYHVAVFPHQYATYVEQLKAQNAAVMAERVAYTVRSGDSLWAIARAYGTTVERLQAANGLRGSTIMAGQVIAVPKGR